MTSGIYTITSPSENVYVGSAVDIDRRWAKHRSIGIKRSEAFKAKVSAGLTGHPVSPETREKIAAKQRGKKVTTEYVQRWRAGLKPVPIEQRRRLACFMHTPEAKQKKAEAMRGHVVSEVTRQKISDSLRGRPHSPERIAAIVAGKARLATAITLQNGG